MTKLKILSTKKLNITNQDLFKASNVDLTQHDFISTSTTTFKLPNHNGAWIFTSKSAVNAVFLSKEKIKCIGKTIYCVGENTKSLLLKNGQKVIKMTKNSSKLADFIKKTAKNENFVFCCGSIKNKAFNTFFKKNNITLTEIPVYKTILNSKKFEKKFNGIMFFSPSGVKSYLEKNSFDDNACICIGETTSNYVSKFSKNIITCDSPSINNVITLTINLFKHESN